MTTTTTTLKTVKIAYTDASIIRMVAKIDMPEYGLTAGQCFYACRSSKNDGTYYLLTWSYERMTWMCRCPATVQNCRHMKLANQDCKKIHVIFSYKPVAAPVVRYDAVAEAEAFIVKVQAEKATKVSGLAETYSKGWYPKTSL